MIAALLLSLVGPAVPSATAPCDGRASDEIVVCRREDPAAQQRYRLPLRDRGFDPLGAVDSVSRSRNRLMDADGGAPDLTRGSCSAVGASGATGCQIRQWRERDQQKGW